jgi:hypothetical protein
LFFHPAFYQIRTRPSTRAAAATRAALGRAANPVDLIDSTLALAQ